MPFHSASSVQGGRRRPYPEAAEAQGVDCVTDRRWTLLKGAVARSLRPIVTPAVLRLVPQVDVQDRFSKVVQFLRQQLGREQVVSSLFSPAESSSNLRMFSAATDQQTVRLAVCVPQGGVFAFAGRKVAGPPRGAHPAWPLQDLGERCLRQPMEMTPSRLVIPGVFR